MAGPITTRFQSADPKGGLMQFRFESNVRRLNFNAWLSIFPMAVMKSFPSGSESALAANRAHMICVAEIAVLAVSSSGMPERGPDQIGQRCACTRAEAVVLKK
jgi:hypothetical protein